MKEIGERTVIAAVVHFLCCIVGVQGQIGVTTCTFSTQTVCPTYFPNSYCDLQFLLCECATAAGYVEYPDGSGCDYNCGTPAAPENGAVVISQGTLAGDVATYSCSNGYKVAGNSNTTCVQGVGWDNTATTCVQGEIGDDCSSDASLCENIPFGYCQGTCKCSPGYEDDGTSQNCQDINECENAICQNGATCVDEINRYTCICSPGYDGTYCTNDIDECVSNPCQNGATCNDLINSYSCTCVNGYTGEHCQTNCEMVVASETEIGIKKPAPYSIHSVSSLSACENLCLSDAKCKEASFLSGSNLFCALYDTSLHDPVLDDKMNEEDKHLQKVCYKGCGSTNSIPNGEITLDSGNTSYGALAAVTCFSGYEADTESVICLEMGNWTNARCLPKDCGEPYKILHGTITTLVRGSTTFGAKANVVCDPGYQVKNSETSVTETDAGTISCLVTGLWEEVYCSAKDQNDAGDSSTILVIILACSLTAAVSIALTTVALFVYRKYKRVKLSTPTSNPEPAVYYNAAVTDNLEGTGADNNQYEHLNVTRETETN